MDGVGTKYYDMRIMIVLCVNLLWTREQVAYFDMQMVLIIFAYK